MSNELNHLSNHIYFTAFKSDKTKGRFGHTFSEHNHLKNLAHWSTKISTETFKKTDAEKEALKKAKIEYKETVKLIKQ